MYKAHHVEYVSLKKASSEPLCGTSVPPSSPFHSTCFSPQQFFIRYKDVPVLVVLHSPKSVPHYVCALCFEHLSRLKTKLCPFCRQPLYLAPPGPYRVCSIIQFRTPRPRDPLPLIHNEFCSPLHVLNFLRDSVVISYTYSFSSNSHAWTLAAVTFTWQCVFKDTAYNVTHILLFPEATVQLTLDEDTAVHFTYWIAQCTEFTLYLYHRTTPPPTTNQWVQIRYFIIRHHLLQLYKAPRNFLPAAAPQVDCVFPVCLPLLLMVAPFEIYFS